jgi:hypothetical protein
VPPQLGDHRGAVKPAGVEDRIGLPDGVLHLRAVTKRPDRAAAGLLATGQLNQRAEARLSDAGDHSPVVRPNLCRRRALAPTAISLGLSVLNGTSTC